jgi:hypothetical protein
VRARRRLHFRALLRAFPQGEKMPPDNDAMRARALRLRAEAVGKGRMLTLGTSDDKRDTAYQRTVALIDSLEADLGGADRLSTAERRIVRAAG